MKKLWILALLPLLFVFGCGKEKIDIWQGAYYPNGLAGNEIYGPIYSNYEACSAWALEKYSDGYDSFCSKICDSFSPTWGVAVCDDVVRTWHPQQGVGNIFEWMEDFKANSFNDLIIDLKNVANEGRSISFIEFRELYPEYVYDWEDVINLFDIIKQKPEYTDAQIKSVAETLYPSLLGK